METPENLKHLQAVIRWLKLRRQYDNALVEFMGSFTPENISRLLGRDYHLLITAVENAICRELELLSDADFPGLISVEDGPLDDAPAPDGVSLN